MINDENIEKLNEENCKNIIEFCLAQIKTEYGYDYNPEWHRDLMSLKQKNGDYSEKNKGSFYIYKVDNEIYGSCGLRDLKFKPSNLELCQRFFGKDSYASLWRTYVPKALRNKGIASKLVEKSLDSARKYGYNKVYLHSSWNQKESVQFWINKGFRIFHEEDNSDKTVHMILDLQFTFKPFSSNL